MRQYLKLFWFFLFIFLILFQVLSFFRFTIIIDAGSTGTRIHLYRYLQSWFWLPTPFIKEIYIGKIHGGLANYADHPQLAGPSLQPKLDEVLKVLKHYSVHPGSVHINVLGTAGMRQLSETQQIQIYQAVKDYLRKHYPFDIKGGYFRTITGQNEGVFSWIDVNYLKNRFLFFRKTLGMLDMGGESTQYTIGLPSGISKKYVTKSIQINHHYYQILSKSFLGFGFDEIDKRLKQDKKGVNCYPKGLAYENKIGQFNFDKCAKRLNEYLSAEPGMQSIPVNYHLNYIAVGGFFHTLNFFDYYSNINELKFKKQIIHRCGTHWQELKIRYPNQIKLEAQCANMVYIYQLLSQYYHIKFKQLKIIREFDGRETSWTRGALIYILENHP